MSSIGPQLPHHLTKRKRTPENDQDPPSPAKNLRTLGPTQRANHDEIDIEDSVDDCGPKAPRPPLEPVLPANNNDEIDLASDSDSDVGPAPPKPAVGVSRPPPAPSKPSGPPPPLAYSDDDSDDEFGPSLPNASTVKPTIGPSMPPAPSSAPQRDSWMLAPPVSTGYSERDPTRIKARTFASKAAPQSSGVSSIWTETPEEKLKRLQDSVLGRSGPATETKESLKSRDDEERDRKIAAKLEARRGKSLLDEHSQARKKMGEDKEEEDDPSKRGFDREKDMALGGKIGTAQRRELMDKAANFGGRFQKGSYL